MIDEASSSFCSQDCFKAAWPEHKAVHNDVRRAWLFALHRGASRSRDMPGFAYTGPLRPHRISPLRHVPDHIPRPDYADRDDGRPVQEMQSRQQKHAGVIAWEGEDLAGIREVCRLAREVLDLAHAAVKPGVTTDEIDRIVHDACVERNAYPSPLNYFSFPKSVCTSINEIICHGIPDAREMEEGDLVNIDVTLYHGGFHGDLNETVLCGTTISDADLHLMRTAHGCLWNAIGKVRPGARYRDLGEAVADRAETAGLSVVKTYCGHGIGNLFHCAPNVPHYRHNKAVGLMKPGHVFTIEPMINAGVWRDVTWPDEWTSATADGKRSAQYEHQMVVTETGVDVLTARVPGQSPPLPWEEGGVAFERAKVHAAAMEQVAAASKKEASSPAAG